MPGTCCVTDFRHGCIRSARSQSRMIGGWHPTTSTAWNTWASGSNPRSRCRRRRWSASDHIDGLEYLGIGFQPAKPMPAASLVGIRPHRGYSPQCAWRALRTTWLPDGWCPARPQRWIQPAVCLAGAADHLATRRVVSRKTAALDTARSASRPSCSSASKTGSGPPERVQRAARPWKHRGRAAAAPRRPARARLSGFSAPPGPGSIEAELGGRQP